ncbi:hypothetical protein U8607_20105 [Methylobacterium durans]|uniref:DUF6894 family protein n=1 Tax=Methylobacterium durans TaxID=2202825 RepID=UPI002AFEC931|nr:hypothetical protein [Methylobacterium durans]MEA1834400.1 hypothetical protein [Methylobacterium durans]
MGRYFFDLHENDLTISDTVGEDLADRENAGHRASYILTQIAGDAPLTDGGKRLSATVRDEANRIVFTATLNIVGEWGELGTEPLG